MVDCIGSTDLFFSSTYCTTYFLAESDSGIWTIEVKSPAIWIASVNYYPQNKNKLDKVYKESDNISYNNHIQRLEPSS